MELINGSIINYEKIITFWGVMKRAVKWTTTLQRTLTGRRALTGQQALMELTVKWLEKCSLVDVDQTTKTI